MSSRVVLIAALVLAASLAGCSCNGNGGGKDSKDRVSALSRQLASGNDAEKLSAAVELGSINSELGTKALMQAADTRDEKLAKAVEDALARHNSPEAVAWLSGDALRGDSKYVRFLAVRALRRINPPGLMQTLLPHLPQNYWEVQIAIFDAIGDQLREPHQAMLISMLQDPKPKHWKVRERLVDRLMQIGTADAVIALARTAGTLVPGLPTSDTSLRHRILERIDVHGADISSLCDADAVASRMASEKDDNALAAMMHFLAACDTNGQHAANIISDCQGRSAQLRMAAMDILAVEGAQPEVVEFMSAGLDDQEASVRIHAAFALGRMKELPAAKILKSLGTETDWRVASALKTVLMLTRDAKVREAVARENEQRPSPALGQVLAFTAGPVAGDASKADAVVGRSLEWLAAHQDSDGAWRAEKTNPYHNVKIFARFDPNVDERFAVSVTSFALLAFCGAGYSHKSGPYSDCMAKGFEWLVSQQKEDGRIDADHKEDKHGLHLVATSFNHLLGTIALCEGYVGAKDDSLKAPAQKALNYVRPHATVGHEYFFDNARIDISTTALLAMTAAAASAAGLEYDDMNVGVTLMFLMKMTDPATGMVLHSLAMSRAGQKYCFGGYGSAAIGLMCAAYSDPKAEKIAPPGAGEKVLGMQRALVDTHLPVWNTRYAITGEGFAPLAPSGKPERQLVAVSVEDIVNYDYWFYAVLGLFLSGDDAPDADWRRWHESLAKVLTEHQEMYGDTRGSFEPECPWSRVAGRVYSTAISALAMEVPQQRLSIFRRRH